MDSNNSLTFGFDIGIASVGWAVLAPDRIVALGVRAFDAAEDKDGKPNNQTRRGARVSRNRYHMRTWRLKRLVRLFRDVGMLSHEDIKHLFSAQHKKHQPPLVSPWQLRAKGMTERLTQKEWAQVIYHLVKHRGFKFFSKKEDPRNADTDDATLPPASQSAEQKEKAGLRDGLEYTAKLLKKYPQFKTLGQAAFHLATAQSNDGSDYRDTKGNNLEIQDCADFHESFRNKGKSYRHAFHRDDLRNELVALFEAQQDFGNPHTDLALDTKHAPLREVPISSETRSVPLTFRDQVFALLELQHPPITSSQMDALIGDCELESEERNGKGRAEKRAAKHSFSNERATWLQTLNNLRIKRDGKEPTLTSEERAALIDLPYTQTKITFKQVREKLRATLGFPAHWREASFTSVSYRSKRKDDGSWLNIITTDGARTPLGKYGPEATRKKAAKELKKRLDVGTMTFAELRQLYELKEGEIFEHQRKESEIVPVSLETTYIIPNSQDIFIKLLPAKSQKSITLKGRAMDALSILSNENLRATLAELRTAIDQATQPDVGWQFEFNRKDSTPILLEAELNTQIPIEYEDAQKAEDETLIELKGWHTLKRKLETAQPEWWKNLQTAWRDPQADNGLAAAHQMDTIAEVLTKAQTDVDVENGLAALALTPDQIAALKDVRFKQYRNLSLKALQNILPGLEAGKSYAEARDTAGYKPLTFERAKFLPPLETYLYKRVRHGKETGYTELRYKYLANPVVARAFNQARLVLNALIDKHGSPAYVHIELARDIAKPLKGHWSGGKYMEGRLDITKRRDENRNKRKAIRENFIENYRISAPTERQMLKERLYHEQLCKCAYTLEKLDPNRVVDDENYAQIDHVWPRSLTFDNSLDNLVLVHAHANQDKGNDIPYDFIKRKYGDEHWRLVQAHILSCKGMGDGKIKRLLASELDADEFLARNLVDTRYSTRLFARMVRDRLLFEGQVEDKSEDIEPSESGKRRLEKFHKTRVRTPQGGVTAFLRRAWLGDIKDREASDKHHAIDACIVAACTPSLIKKVNDWFAQQERMPNQFSKNADGTYTDHCTGEIVSKQQARDRGLYLAPPWDNFRSEFFEEYTSLWVSRAVRKKKNNEAHDANPIAWQNEYLLSRTPLKALTQDMLDREKLPVKFRNTTPVIDFFEKNSALIHALRKRLGKFDGNAQLAFATPFYPTLNDSTHALTPIKAIRLPKPSPKSHSEKVQIAEDGKEHRHKITEESGYKTVSLTDLKLDALTEKSLGEQYYRRNKLFIDALVARLRKHSGDAEKAFKQHFYKPINPERNRKGKPTPERGPRVRSIRIPKNKTSGLHIRGGVAELGDALYTEVYWTGKSYFFLPRYAASAQHIFGIDPIPDKSVKLFSLTQNDMIEAILDDGTCHFGYFVMYEGDGRLQIRDHDQQKKGAHRFGIAKLKSLRKFKVGLLGDYTSKEDNVGHGLA